MDIIDRNADFLVRGEMQLETLSCVALLSALLPTEGSLPMPRALSSDSCVLLHVENGGCSQSDVDLGKPMNLPLQLHKFFAAMGAVHNLICFSQNTHAGCVQEPQGSIGYYTGFEEFRWSCPHAGYAKKCCGHQICQHCYTREDCTLYCLR